MRPLVGRALDHLFCPGAMSRVRGMERQPSLPRWSRFVLIGAAPAEETDADAQARPREQRDSIAKIPRGDGAAAAGVFIASQGDGDRAGRARP